MSYFLVLFSYNSKESRVNALFLLPVCHKPINLIQRLTERLSLSSEEKLYFVGSVRDGVDIDVGDIYRICVISKEDDIFLSIPPITSANKEEMKIRVDRFLRRQDQLHEKIKKILEK